MPVLTLRGLFEGLQDELPPELERVVGTAAALAEPAGSGEYVALRSSEDRLAVERGGVEIFDQPFTVTGNLAADLLVYAPGKEVPILGFVDPRSGEPVFDGEETLVAPSDHVPAELRFQANADLAGQLEPPLRSGLTLTANAAAGAGLVYRHVRPAPASSTRLEALTDLLATSRPPALVPLGEIAPGEIHVVETLLHLDLGLRARYGTAFDLEADLAELFSAFDGMGAEVRAHVSLALDASVGFSLYEHSQIALGRFNTAESGWVRIRLQKIRRSELTLGAKLAVQVQYDLASATFTALLERILELDPTARLMETLEEVQRLRRDGGWNAVRDRLVEELGEEVDGLLQDASWRDWLGDDDATRIDDLLDRLNDLVRRYEELPDKVRSLWGSLLASVDLGPGSQVVAALRQIAAIDPADPEAILEDLLGDGWRDARDLLEVLSGQSVEELVLGRSEAVQSVLARAQELASEALGFLDGVPDRAIGLIRRYAERTGIEGAVAWLRENATDLDSLEASADGEIRKLVARLLGKAWDRLQPEDLERLGTWLDRMEALLAQKEELGERLRAIVRRLDGEAGFSLTLELNRLTERYALLDLELDPTHSRLEQAAKAALVRGNAKELLERLPSDGDDDAAIRLRDAVFIARRVRTSALGAFFSFLGLRTRRTVRVDEETVRVLQGESGFRRVGSYAGGAVRSLGAGADEGRAQKEELGLWLTLGAEGAGGDLAAGYDRGRRGSGLRVTFVREDDKTLDAELRGLDDLLDHLGFHGAHGQRLEDLPPGPVLTRFALQLRLRDAAVEALVADSDEDGWNLDFLNAGHRWFDDELLPDEYGPMKTPRLREGRVLAALLETEDFQRRWQDGVRFLETDPGNWNLRIDARPVRVIVTRRTGGQRILLLTGIQDLMGSRARSFAALDATRQSYTALGPKPLPADLREAARRFARTAARTAGQATGWPSVLFNLWLVLARVTRRDPQALDEARGLAVLRWKRRPADEWNGPLHWRARGVPVHRGEDSVFPVG